MHAKDAAGQLGRDRHDHPGRRQDRARRRRCQPLRRTRRGGDGSVTLTAHGQRRPANPSTAIVAAEWFIGAATPASATARDGCLGDRTGTLSATIDVSSWHEGAYILYVAGKDAAGNWSSPSSTSLSRDANRCTSPRRATPTRPAWPGRADDADIYGWNGTGVTPGLRRDRGRSVAGRRQRRRLRPGRRHALLRLLQRATRPCRDLGTVQDEDVVFWNAGTWSVYFDGTARGLTARQPRPRRDQLVAGTLYFSTLGNTNPPGVGGAADDADIYSWNGDVVRPGLRRHRPTACRPRPTSTASSGVGRHALLPVLQRRRPRPCRAWDRSRTRTSSTTTAGPGRSYFDGTAHGLTSGNLDVDAFDVP